jgi:hypothetical protein
LDVDSSVRVSLDDSVPLIGWIDENSEKKDFESKKKKRESAKLKKSAKKTEKESM